MNSREEGWIYTIETTKSIIRSPRSKKENKEYSTRLVIMEVATDLINDIQPALGAKAQGWMPSGMIVRPFNHDEFNAITDPAGNPICP